MVAKRKEYLDVFNNLRMVAENFKVDIKGNILSKNDNIEINNGNIVRMRFCVLYAYAYKKYLESLNEKVVNEISEELIVRALSDYSVFRSFINNSIIEYNMYNRIGTGNISYFPYQALADFLFKMNNIPVVTDYLKCELGENLDISSNKGRVH